MPLFMECLFHPSKLHGESQIAWSDILSSLDQNGVIYLFDLYDLFCFCNAVRKGRAAHRRR